MKSTAATRRPSRNIPADAVEDAYDAADLAAYRNRDMSVTGPGYRRAQRSRQSKNRR